MFKFFTNLSSAAAVFGLVGACSSSTQSALNASTTSTTTLNISSQDLFNTDLAWPQAEREAFYGSIGQMTLPDYFAMLIAGASDERISIDGMAVQGQRSALEAGRSFFTTQLPAHYATMSALWDGIGVNPSTISYERYKQVVGLSSGQAGLGLTQYIAINQEQKPCDNLYGWLGSVGVSPKSVASSMGHFPDTPLTPLEPVDNGTGAQEKTNIRYIQGKTTLQLERHGTDFLLSPASQHIGFPTFDNSVLGQCIVPSVQPFGGDGKTNTPTLGDAG